MEYVKINTSQNVEIDYTIAGLGDRVIAFMIDTLVLSCYAFVLVFSLGIYGPGFTSANVNFMIVFIVLLYLPFILYDLICEIFMNGQSIGKRIMKIRVVKLDNTPPGIGDYILRWILRPVDISFSFGGVAIITMLVNGKGQRIGDLAAGTTVVKVKSKVTLDDTILTRLREDYQPVYSQVRLLSDKDIMTVKKVLDSFIENPKISEHLAFRTKTAIEKKLSIQSQTLPRHFLETILKDYNYYAQHI
jgi:uncharacterized RDD family membrane protein YckC